MEKKYSAFLVISPDEVNVVVKRMGTEEVVVEEMISLQSSELKSSLQKMQNSFLADDEKSMFVLGGTILFGVSNFIAMLFTVLIPLYNEKRNTNKEICSEMVLVVDDDDMIREVIELCLKKRGLLVNSVSSPIEALKILSNHPNDYITLITDYRMPQINGVEFIQLLESSELRLKNIIITSPEIGFDDHIDALLSDNRTIRKLIKPFTEEDLLGVLAE